MMRQHLTPDLTAYGNTVLAGDSLYLREMDVWTLSRGFGNNFGSLRNAPSDLGIVDEFEDGFARLRGTWRQDLIQDQRFGLQQLPQLWVTGRRDLPGGFAYVDYDTEAVNYWRRRGVQGMRLSLNPKVTAPWRWGDYLYGYATAGIWGNFYDTSGHEVGVVPVGKLFNFGPPLGKQVLVFNNGLKSGGLTQGGLNARGIPYLQTGIATELERVWEVNGSYIEKLKNTIEPFVMYNYTPPISQSSMPLFDERDRINARSMIVYGFTTRLYARTNLPTRTTQVPENPDVESGAVRSADAGQTPETPYGGETDDRYDNTNAMVSHSGGNTTHELFAMTLMQAYDTNFEFTENQGDLALSDVQGIFTLFPTSIVSLGSQLDYDPRTHPGLSFASIEMNLQPPWNSERSSLYMGKALQGSFLQVSYNYVRPQNAVTNSTARNGSQFLAVRTYYDVLDRLGLYFAPNYDFASGRALSTQYGVRLKSPCNCWAFDTGITDSFNPNEVQVQVQLTLGGLGSVGQSPFGRNPFTVMGLAGQSTGVLPGY